MRSQFTTTRHIALTLAGMLCASVVPADDAGHHRQASGAHDHDRARQALERGEVRPIADLLTRVAKDLPGEVVEVEFEHMGRGGGESWIYALKILADDGRLLEVQVDAATGHILTVEED